MIESMIYFADRYHLREYGRPITNDEYFAISYGPVNSGVKDIAEMNGFLGEKELDYASRFVSLSGDTFRYKGWPGYEEPVILYH